MVSKRKKSRQHTDTEQKKKLRLSKDEALADGVFAAAAGRRTRSASDWDQDEQDYELQARAIKGQRTRQKLPIKTAQGKVISVDGSDDELSEEEEEEEQDEEGNLDQQDEEKTPNNEEDAEAHKSEKELIFEAKEKLAEISQKILEDPEENIGGLKLFREVMTSRVIKVKQLAILSMFYVLKDIIPGYRIRPLSEVEAKSKVSKEVKQLRTFEETLLASYKSYIMMLKDLCHRGKPNPEDFNSGVYRSQPSYRLGLTAITTVCNLLSSVGHFNFRIDLISIVVGRVSRRPIGDTDQGFWKCVKCLEQLFEQDNEGRASFEAVSSLIKMMKDRHFKVDESILNTFLHLKLLSSVDVQMQDESERELKPKIAKKDRVFRTKKERKAAKERKEIDLEMEKAERAVTAEETAKLQSDTLRAVFATYFRILQSVTYESLDDGNKKAGARELMGPALEGLARFAYLINADFFGDLLAVLRELLSTTSFGQTGVPPVDWREGNKQIREALLCIVTAFTLFLHQHGESAHLDLTFFINAFYRILLVLPMDPDIELSNRSLRLEDPLKRSGNKSSSEGRMRSDVNLSTDMEMAYRIMQSIFLGKSRQFTSKARVQAMSKRFATAVLNLPEKSAILTLNLLTDLSKRYPSAMSIEFSTKMDDRLGNGLFNSLADTPEQSNPETATMYEAFLLEKHYSPQVASMAKKLPSASVVS